MSFDYGPIIATVVGSALKASGEKSQGAADDTLARFQAAQLRQNAGQTRAAGTIAAAETARQYRLAQSRALALAAASGGSAADPTVINILANLAGAGDVATRTQIFNANEQARGQEDQAAATEYGGKLAKQAGNTRALNTVLSGAYSIYDRLRGGESSGPASYSGSLPDTPEFDWHNIGSGGDFINDGQY